MKNRNLLIIFIRNRVAGRVKTRLAASIGPERAMRIYHMLLVHTREVAEAVDVRKEVWYSDSIEREDMWSLPEFTKKVQPAGDLGARMSRAFQTGFENGYQKVVITGSDCLQIRQDHLETAFRELDKRDLVVGPSKDGGYYLLGLRKWIPEIFRDKPWSRPALFRETLQTAKEKKITWSELEVLNDIDTIDDLKKSRLWPENNRK